MALFIYLKNSKTYPRIGFFRKLPYPGIRILPIPIRVSVSVLHRHQNQIYYEYLELPLKNIGVSVGVPRVNLSERITMKD